MLLLWRLEPHVKHLLRRGHCAVTCGSVSTWSPQCLHLGRVGVVDGGTVVGGEGAGVVGVLLGTVPMCVWVHACGSRGDVGASA